MTGAGSGRLIFGHEGEFANSIVDSNSDGTPDLFAFGRDPTVSELSLDNALSDLREGDEVWAQESVKGNFEGAINVEAAVSADVHKEVEKIVWNDGGTAMQSGLANSARVFAGVDYFSGTQVEELLGCIPLSWDLNYNQGETLTYSLNMAYADQRPDPDTDLSTATEVSDGSTLPWHALDVTIDGTSVEDLQSLGLSLSEIARLQYGGSPTANRGVIAAPTAELSVNALFTTPNRLDIARGATDSAPPDTLDSVTGTITLTNPYDGSTLSTYNLAKLKPQSHSWNEIVSPDDSNDDTTFSVTGGVTVA